MKLTFLRCDDWEGLYKDGVLEAEGHSIQWEYELKRLGFDIEYHWVQEWMDEESYGRMPALLSEVTYFDE